MFSRKRVFEQVSFKVYNLLFFTKHNEETAFPKGTRAILDLGIIILRNWIKKKSPGAHPITFNNLY
jgi:hypothetical protein